VLSFGVDGIPVPLQRKAGDIQNLKAALFHLGTDIALRKHGNAQPSDHRLFNGLATPELHVGLEDQFFASKRLIDGGACSGTGFPTEESLLEEVSKRNVPSSGEGMIPPADDDKRVVQKKKGFHR
jgi:hypothetical protein